MPTYDSEYWRQRRQMAVELGMDFIEPELFPCHDGLSDRIPDRIRKKMEELERAEKELRFQSQIRQEDPKPIPARKGWRQSRNRKQEER